MNPKPLSEMPASRLVVALPPCSAEVQAADDKQTRFESDHRLRGLVIGLLAACAGFFALGFVLFFAAAATRPAPLSAILAVGCGGGVLLCTFGALAVAMPRKTKEVA